MPLLTRSYTVPVNIRHTTSGASGIIWALTNLGRRTLFMRRIFVNATFDGTPEATTMVHNIRRYRGTAASGGTATPPVQNNINANLPASGASAVDVRYLDLGLTFPGSTDPQFASFMGSRGAKAVAQYDLHWPPWGEVNTVEPISIIPGEGIAMLSSTTVIGDGIYGFVSWDEDF